MIRTSSIAALLCALVATPAAAHFQELIPSLDIVPVEGAREVVLDMAFTHPMERGPVMEMARPLGFGVLSGGRDVDLSAALEATTRDGKPAYRAVHRFTQPGDHIFHLDPTPYWEAAERKFIRHYTKVVVDMGGGEDWDALVGFPIEIKPLSRPYGTWTGNLFRGVALRDGKPKPGAELEVEWRNDGAVTAPSDPFITQVIKADDRGVFAYAMPRAGWWVFNVMDEAAEPMTAPDGKPAPVEIGGTIWVHAVDMR